MARDEVGLIGGSSRRAFIRITYFSFLSHSMTIEVSLTISSHFPFQRDGSNQCKSISSEGWDTKIEH